MVPSTLHHGIDEVVAHDVLERELDGTAEAAPNWSTVTPTFAALADSREKVGR